MTLGDGRRPNVLFITLDQFRGDHLGAASPHPSCTPNLDRLATEGVCLAAHYSQAAPCGPGRASLYTGMYQFNHRVVANGTPLDRRFDNVALAAQRAGYRPVLFGYTDQALDPRDAKGPDDPRLTTYEGVLPGFEAELDLSGSSRPWKEWLAERGHDVSIGLVRLLETEHERNADHSVSAFLTDRVVEWLEQQRGGAESAQPWFVHASYLRPHPPFSAAGEWATAFPADTLTPPLAPVDEAQRHPFHSAAMRVAAAAAPTDAAALTHIRSQYRGMVGEVDHCLGRLRENLVRLGWWDDTVVIVTSDHGEQLGDHGLIGKLGFFEQSFHIPGIVRDPRRAEAHGRIVEHFTENVDLFPTICDLIGTDVPRQCDGRSLLPFLDGAHPIDWRHAAHWEFDWRDQLLNRGRVDEWPGDRSMAQHYVATIRTGDAAYARFGDGSSVAFDLATDPTWRTELTDAEAVLELAETMLDWRAEHADRNFTSIVLGSEGGPGV